VTVTFPEVPPPDIPVPGVTPVMVPLPGATLGYGNQSVEGCVAGSTPVEVVTPHPYALLFEATTNIPYSYTAAEVHTPAYLSRPVGKDIYRVEGNEFQPTNKGPKG
jgi:hypothetical protein